MSTTNYRHGDHNCVDDYSGFKVKRSECRYTWDGYLVHRRFWEPRQPQDLVRGVPDHQAVKDTRPARDPQFVGVNEVTQDDL